METLYRKYRPIDFDSVVGQTMIVKTLRNQIIRGSVSQAYLFSGTRGTGKTTIARIFARSVNCPNEKNGNPCNECSTCKSTMDGQNLNIIEMDAASNNGVDDIRRISELISYPPLNDEKHKVFIIDEVHALTPSAFQAFLKILEDPPEYVIYILATTDPNRVPETILSRCQKYNFKRIKISDIVSYLRKICDMENISIDDEALSFIAEKSDGSMRESISKLDRCRSFAINEKITKQKVEEILGIVGDEEFIKLTDYINNGNIKNALLVFGESIDKGKDIIQFANDLVWFLRNLLMTKELDKPIESLNITESNFVILKEKTKDIAKETLILFIEELSKTIESMKYDENRRVIFETTLIRLANPRSIYISSSIVARINSIEDKIKNNTYIKMPEKVNLNEEENNSENNKNIEKEEKKIKIVKLEKATYEELQKIVENWDAVISRLSIVPKSIIKVAKLIPNTEKDASIIRVLIKEDEEYGLLNNQYKLEDLEENLKIKAKELFNKEIVFNIEKLNETKFVEDTECRIANMIQEKISMPIEEEKEKND